MRRRSRSEEGKELSKEKSGRKLAQGKRRKRGPYSGGGKNSSQCGKVTGKTSQNIDAVQVVMAGRVGGRGGSGVAKNG